MRRLSQRRIARQPKQRLEKLDLDGDYDSVESFHKGELSHRQRNVNSVNSFSSRNSADLHKGYADSNTSQNSGRIHRPLHSSPRAEIRHRPSSLSDFGQHEHRQGHSQVSFEEERGELNVIEDYDMFATYVVNRKSHGLAPENHGRELISEKMHRQNLADCAERRVSPSQNMTRNLPPSGPNCLVAMRRRAPIEEHDRWSEGVSIQSLGNSVFADPNRAAHPVDNPSAVLKTLHSESRSDSSSSRYGKFRQYLPNNRSPSTRLASSSTSRGSRDIIGSYEGNVLEQSNDPELEVIRRKFLQPDSWSYASSTSSYRGNATNWTSYIDPYKEEEGIEGLPAGYCRRKDGVIMSVASSVNSAQDFERYDYTSKLLAETIGELNIRHADEHLQMDSSSSQSTTSCTDKRTNSTSTHNNSSSEHSNSMTGCKAGTRSMATTTTKQEDRNVSLLATIVQSFEEQIDNIRSSLDLNAKTSVGTASFENRAKVRQGQFSSNRSATSDSIRRAKVKSDCTGSKDSERKSMLKEPSGATLQELERGSTPILVSSNDNDARRLGDDVSHSRTFDDSTITTKASYAERLNAEVDISHLQRYEKGSFEGDPALDQSSNPLGSARTRTQYEQQQQQQQHQQQQHQQQQHQKQHQQQQQQQQQLPLRQKQLPPQKQQQQQQQSTAATATMLGIDSINPHADDKSLISTAKEQEEMEEMYNRLLPFKRKVGFSGIYPELTRKGDRVPELVTHHVPGSVSVISDLSSTIPRSKAYAQSSESLRHGKEAGGTGVSTDMFGGFFDKLTLACRLAVFQPNGCN
jgi:hypothetical protein